MPTNSTPPSPLGTLRVQNKRTRLLLRADLVLTPSPAGGRQGWGHARPHHSPYPPIQPRWGRQGSSRQANSCHFRQACPRPRRQTYPRHPQQIFSVILRDFPPSSSAQAGDPGLRSAACLISPPKQATSTFQDLGTQSVQHGFPNPMRASSQRPTRKKEQNKPPQ